MSYRPTVTNQPVENQRVSLRVSSTSHRITIRAENRDDVVFDGNATLSVDEDEVTIDSARGALMIRVPTGTAVMVGSDSGRIKISGEVGDVAVLTESGAISIDRAESLDARTSSARVEVKSLVGKSRVRTKSGRVVIGACGGADVATDSGRITLKHVDGQVKAHCVSGRIDVQMDAAHDIEAETVSGRVNVSYPRDVVAWNPSEHPGASVIPGECDCTVRVRSVSGRVNVSER